MYERMDDKNEMETKATCNIKMRLSMRSNVELFCPFTCMPFIRKFISFFFAHFLFAPSFVRLVFILIDAGLVCRLLFVI